MDRNSAIGLTLIAALLFVYFTWFASSPTPEPQNTPQSAAQNEKPSTSGRQVTPEDDSVRAASYGDLSALARGTQSPTRVENEDLIITFSNRGGIVQEVELKKYKTYSQEALKLITGDRTSFGLTTNYQGKEIDLYDLYYTVQTTKQADTTIVSFTAKMDDGSSISHIYAIPAKGYEVKYRIRQSGFEQKFTGDNFIFTWNDRIRPMEKDLEDTRNHTTVTFFRTDDGFDDISESGVDTEQLTAPVKWIAIKQKFFLSSLIAENTAFASGVATTILNDKNDSSLVKQADIKLLLPKADVIKGVNLKYYFGPNDYQVIGDVAEDFNKNVYLGWPPVYWINKYVIFPVFHFLTKYISNYGIIIIVLVILLRLVLAPLSYKSFISMAKMRVLKPELDEIKEKTGDDMAKVQQEQLKLYQQVGVNPISGCVPVLLQMPILFAMFYLFPASIELRQQKFLWAEDLSTYDSIIRLPFQVPFLGDHISIFTLLMTITTLIYTWQNNQTSSVTGPMKTMSLIMPLIFFFMLNRFSAGLTFYYTMGTVLTFAQQAIIKRFVDENKIRAILEENRKKNVSGTAKKSKFMSKLEDAMKASEEARKKMEEEKKKRKK